MGTAVDDRLKLVGRVVLETFFSSCVVSTVVHAEMRIGETVNIDADRRRSSTAPNRQPVQLVLLAPISTALFPCHNGYV